MALTESQLLADAAEIKEEVIPNANSALRVGVMLENIIKSTTKPYDSTATYKAGQYVFFNSAAWRSLNDVAIGESPALVPTKWKAQDKSTLDQLAQDTPELEQDTYEAERVSVVKDGKLRAMSWERLTAYVAVLMPDNIVGGFAARIRKYLYLDDLARISVLTVNLIFRGTANVLGIRDVGENTPFGLLLNRAGKGFIWGIYFDESGNLIAKVDGSERLLIRADQFAINHDTINLNGTVTVNDFYQRFPALNNNPDYFITGQQTANGVHTGIIRPADFERWLFSRPAFQNLVGSSSSLIVLKDEIECYQEVVPDPTYDGPYTVTAATLGQPRPHLLNAPGSQILPILTRSDGQPEQALVVSFPSNSTYQIDYAVPGDSGYSDNGALELKKRKS